MLETAVAEVSPELVSSSDTGDAGEVWIEALPARVYTTPQYGEIPVTVDKLERFIANFTNRVRGQDIATDFEHGRDPAKGLGASGWYRGFEIRPSSDDPEQQSLFANVAFTDEAKKEIQEGKWKYWSLEWDDEYVTDSGEMVPDVILGGGLTNRPVAKRTMPINFSEALWQELDDDTKREFAVWSTAFVNGLPDSAFLYVESGGSKDSSGKTTPRTLRHLPYKDSSGKIDLPHLRNAIARIPQMSGVSDSLKASLQARARKLLGAKSQSMSEDESVQIAFDLLTERGYEITGETKEKEHAEPGTGSPPAPRTFEDGSDDPAIQQGWRRDPLPNPSVKIPTTGPDTNSQGGDSQVPPDATENGDQTTLDDELAELLSVPPDKVKETVTTLFSEMTELRRAVNASAEEKQFAEKFPSYWREHQELMQRDRNGRARAFSESVSHFTKPEGDKFVPTGVGLSALAMDKITEVHIKFAEGIATLADFEEVVKTITQGGTVAYGENGSSRVREMQDLDVSNAAGISSVRKLFAEKIAETQRDNPDMSYQDAIAKTAELYPDIAAAYRVPAPA
jgi:hypothetical protein